MALKNLFSWLRDQNLRTLFDGILDGKAPDPIAARRGLDLLRVDSQNTIRAMVTPEFYKLYYPSTRMGGPWGPRRPVGIVDHFTGATTAAGTLRWFSSEPRKPGEGNSSAHVVIDRDGTVLIVINPLTVVAFHATSANPTHIGIEHVNCGRLKKLEGTGGFLFMDTLHYPEARKSQVQEVNGEHWEPYTAAQLASNIFLKKLFRAAIPTLDPKSIVQHKDIDPTRKVDCGPLWPAPEINDLVFRNVAFRGMDWVTKDTLTVQDTQRLRQEIRTLLGHR